MKLGVRWFRVKRGLWSHPNDPAEWYIYTYPRCLSYLYDRRARDEQEAQP